ncbi:sulfotransferase family protein [Paraburkholderia diazotrophica]|uniref:Sulfotransferase family protein n=1 Tax=Paraburkholderia diazotrophica TaxID=667676 RepID=A0A1H7E9P0_9BURK|nr:sulfotransferase [Paraburkholderia diazotrophica]SEK08792.1 Sulfotransferase family protein [Paraburkholderia diazotrophica]
MTLPERFTGAEDALHAAASGVSGLSDFGAATEYMPGLTQFLIALDEDGPRFVSGGREFAWNALVGALVSRLVLVEGLRKHAGAMPKMPRRPLVITGIPRTGTTALHKLLSVDPQFQGLEKWLTVFPQPRPPRGTWGGHAQFQATAAGLEAFFKVAPEMRAAHNIVADEVDECLEILKQGFCSNLWGSSFRVPQYDGWWREQSELPAYRYFAKAIGLIGASDNEKTWLLKNPGHIMQLPALFEVFPGACVVQTHRDPVQALPSLASVLTMARRVSEGERVDKGEIGLREMENWARAADAAMEARAHLPTKQFLDIRQKDFQADPIGTVRRIYGYFGFRLSAETEDAMRERVKQNPERAHGAHDYTPEEFGLAPGATRERFSRYMTIYGLDR